MTIPVPHQNKKIKTNIRDALFSERYEADVNNGEAFYGLPQKVEFCKRCVISNQRPNSDVEFSHNAKSRKKTIRFDEVGICDACRLSQQKSTEVDWLDRQRQLEDLCDRYRKHGLGYDCLVPGSGGKDSFFVAHQLKYKYGMNPLSCTFSPNIYTEWGRKNFYNWIEISIK